MCQPTGHTQTHTSLHTVCKVLLSLMHEIKGRTAIVIETRWAGICITTVSDHSTLEWRFVTKYVEIKCQLDATEVFIADRIACSTCFEHHYAHLQAQEYYTVVAACGISCCGFQVVGLVWS